MQLLQKEITLTRETHSRFFLDLHPTISCINVSVVFEQITETVNQNGIEWIMNEKWEPMYWSSSICDENMKTMGGFVYLSKNDVEELFPDVVKKVCYSE